MKSKIIAFILAGVFFAACNETDYNSPSSADLMGDSLVVTYSIKQLKAEFLKSTDAYSDLNKLTDLYTSDRINSAKPVVIGGYITSSDIEGNVYKYFVIQENKRDSQAIKVAIDASGLSAVYPLGQYVTILCNDLHIGNYGQSPQIGTKYINKTRSKTAADGRVIYRVEPGRMAFTIAKNHIHAYGLPDPNVIKPDTMTIAQIIASDHNKIVNKLVYIKNAYFTGKDGSDKILLGSDLIFAPGTNGVGYPQTRMISDGTGNIAIATSEYAKFASKPLPSSNYRGDITVIIGWYKNYADNSPGSWQLTLRTLSDLGKGFEGYLNQINYKK